MKQSYSLFRRGFSITAILLFSYFGHPVTAQGLEIGANPITDSALTANWAVKNPRGDGTFQKAYFDLKYDGRNITGTIRVTQFYYTISESTVTNDGFTITAKMKDGRSDRTVKYEGRLIGDELHLSTRRRPEDKP